MAAKMIDLSTSLTDGLDIVKQAKETQTHHHTKTCRKHGSNCRFGMPRFPMWRTMITKDMRGKTAEERCERKKKHNEVLGLVREVLEDKEAIGMIFEEKEKKQR